jgi:predicted Fe-S protein YdhL (DUF1289 family)
MNVCALDERGYCIGCYRTIEEIAGWPSLSPTEKRTVLEAALGRRAAVPAPHAPATLEIDQ